MPVFHAHASRSSTEQCATPARRAPLQPSLRVRNVRTLGTSKVDFTQPQPGAEGAGVRSRDALLLRRPRLAGCLPVFTIASMASRVTTTWQARQRSSNCMTQRDTDRRSRANNTHSWFLWRLWNVRFAEPTKITESSMISTLLCCIAKHFASGW